MNAVSFIADHISPAGDETSAGGVAHDVVNDVVNDPDDQKASGGSDVELSPEDTPAAGAAAAKPRNRALLWSIVVFLPNVFLVKPILFLWFIVTFPLSLVERTSQARERVAAGGSDAAATGVAAAVDDGTAGVAVDLQHAGSVTKFNTIVEEEDDDLAGDEMILQPDAAKDSLTAEVGTPAKPNVAKTTSSTRASVRSGSSGAVLGSRRMGRFLFPKKLVPQSVRTRSKRKTLVLDLDETLIHSMSRATSSSNSSQAHMVEVKFAVSGISTLYYVHKRPYCDLFLSKVAVWYDLVIFTASMKEYADPVIDWLEGSFPGRFSQRLYRQHCILRDGVGYIKDLSLLSHSAPTDVFIVDNSPVSYAMHVDNAIRVEGWISDPTDTDLLNLLPLLQALRFTTDVRYVLSLKNGEHAFTSR
ncbi:LAMI_0F10792g1_1 [Lachancea mirantina]|uniref:LAMI_0F10792g1_1 n=1 Tax=Lachancea mirantina TaxID=1230905 RepID=A0A1G4K225_9SACH|nr:LAMI_0F10792g1_1 [Lachancea mirantina]